MTRSHNFLEHLIHKYSSYKINRLRLSTYAEFGRNHNHHEARLLSAKFIHNEGPIRLAHMIRELNSLPGFMLQQPLLAKVHSWYLDSFRDLVELPHIDTSASADVDRYTDQMSNTLKKILRRHAPVVMTMANGLKQLKDRRMLDGIQDGVTEFQDRFYMSRIGIRFLFNQHLALFSHKEQSDMRRWIGSIDAKCSVAEIAEDAINNATFLCQQRYLAAPPARIVTPGRSKDRNITFTYVPSHLYHILFELVKNSFRAVIEHHDSKGGVFPEVRIAIVKGEEDMTIKISDEGGGMSHRHIKDAFTYFYSTAPPPQGILASDIDDTSHMTDMNNAPLAGLGYGLPISRLYARYFGGDLDLISIDGFGTDAYVYLRAAAENAVEVLPTYSDKELKYAANLESAGRVAPHWLRAGLAAQPV